MTYLDYFVDTFGRVKRLKLRFHRESRLRYRAESLEVLFNNEFELLKKYIDHH